jgi:tetratricopeptide (TPR) repeat protein
MHELLREYAAEQLARADGSDIIRDRHAAYYTAAAEGWREGLRGPRQGEVSAEMAPDVANVQAAWNWAVQRGSVEWLDRMLDGLCGFYEHSARFREGTMACQSAAAALETQPDGRERLLARVLTWQAIFDWMLGRTEPARALFQRSLDLLAQLRLDGLDVRREEAAALLGLAKVLDHTGDRNGSRALCEQSLARYRALDDRHGMAQALLWLGVNALYTGHCAAARKLLEESLAIQRSLGDKAGVARALRYLVDLSCNEGELAPAEGLARECIAIAREAQDHETVAGALFQLACVTAYEGAFAEAHALLEEVVPLCDRLGLLDQLAVAQDIVIWMKINLGDYAAARPLALANLGRLRQIGNARATGVQLLGSGEIALAEGRLADALAFLTESADVLGQIGQRDEQGLALAHLADLASLLGQPGQARKYLRQALQAASETKHFAASLSSVVSAAVCLAGEGQTERAVELYSLAARHPYVGNSKFRYDIAGKHIAAPAASRPPETVAAAQARGRARDLRLTLAKLVSEFGQADRGERSVALSG